MKGNLLQGTARGRMGDIVAKVVHGKQIYAKYQPVVFNRNSPLQVVNRGRFSKAVESYKELKNELVLGGYDFAYNLYSGASKSLRNIAFNFMMQAQDLGDNQGNSRSIKMIEPLISSNTIGNLLPALASSGLGTNDLIPSFAREISVIGNDQWFGSDVPLETETRLIVIGTDDEAPFYTILASELQRITISQEDRSVNIGLPKEFGFKDSLEDVGEWNYIYKLKQTLDTGAKGFVYEDTTTTISLYYFWINKNGRILSAGSLSRFGSTV